MRAMSAVSRAASVPRAAIAIPTSALASAGASLTPSPTIATRPETRRRSRNALDLVLGQEVGGPDRDPGLGGDHARGPLVVAGQHRRLDPQRPQRGHRGRRLRDARRRRPRSRPPCAAGLRRPRPAPPSCPRLRGAAARRRGGGRTAPARRTSDGCRPAPRDPPTRPRTPRPGATVTSAAAGTAQPEAARVGDQRLPHRMRAAGLHRGRQPDHLRRVAALEGDDVGDVRLAAGERARLVEDDLAHAADLLEVRAALDQHSDPRRGGERGDDGHRGRDHERAGARDDQQDERAVAPLGHRPHAGQRRHHRHQERRATTAGV